MNETMRANLIYIFLLIVVMSSSCGTITSNVDLNRAIKQNGQDNIVCGKTSPFIYSGVMFDANIANSCLENIEYCRGNILGLLIYDSLLSSTADTIILPFSIYRQHKYCWSILTDNIIK